MPRADTTVYAAALRVLLRGARAHGLDVQPLLDAAGLGPDDVETPDGRVPRGLAYQLWDDVTALSGDEALGLKLALATPEGITGVVEYVCRNSATLGEALRNVVRYARLLHDGADIRLAESEDEVSFTHRLVDSSRSCPRGWVDWFLGYILVASRQMVGPDLTPVRVTFQHGPAQDLGLYARVFGCPIRWHAPLNTIAFRAADLARPVAAADVELARLMRHFADDQLDRLPRTEDFQQQVRAAVCELMCHGAPRLDDVARRVGLSGRSLQRKLSEAGTSFQAFVGDVRTELAASYLAERDLAIAEIAFMLGYSDPSAFHRSFKRARGVTPSVYRERAAA
ncbi:MAG: AraC family transcriptional regulator [Myxococcales bacterium]|nr:AraC family transcriptional regulator [Myxococcales bacterium]